MENKIQSKILFNPIITLVFRTVDFIIVFISGFLFYLFYVPEHLNIFNPFFDASSILGVIILLGIVSLVSIFSKNISARVVSIIITVINCILVSIFVF